MEDANGRGEVDWERWLGSEVEEVWWWKGEQIKVKESRFVALVGRVDFNGGAKLYRGGNVKV